MERAHVAGTNPPGKLPTFGQASQPVEKTGPTLPLQKRENIAWRVTWLYRTPRRAWHGTPKTMGIELTVCHGTCLYISNKDIMVLLPCWSTGETGE